jgi:hypothetical protein
LEPCAIRLLGNVDTDVCKIKQNLGVYLYEVLLLLFLRRGHNIMDGRRDCAFQQGLKWPKKKKKERQTRCPTGPGHDTTLPTRGSFSLSMTLVLHYLQRYGSPDWSLPRLRHRVPSSLSLSLHPRSTPPIDSRYTYHFLSIDVDLNSRPSCLFPSTATLPVNRHLIPPV